MLLFVSNSLFLFRSLCPRIRSLLLIFSFRSPYRILFLCVLNRVHLKAEGTMMTMSKEANVDEDEDVDVVVAEEMDEHDRQS